MPTGGDTLDNRGSAYEHQQRVLEIDMLKGKCIS